MSRLKSLMQYRPIRIIVGYIGGPLLSMAISVVIISRLTNVWEGPDPYVVYVVGNFDAPVARDVYRGIQETASRLDRLTIDGAHLAIKSVNDHGDATRAQTLARKVARQPDALMIVGHFDSTSTREALPVYMQASPAIPVILPTETSPNLLPPAERTGQYLPVFRLSPTDERQAERAAKYAIKAARSVFWIVEDTENPVYARYLGTTFTQRVQEGGKSVVLWTPLGVPPGDAYRLLPVDCVFFVGEPRNALIVIEQVNALWPKGRRPLIILSDAAVDGMLLTKEEVATGDIVLLHPSDPRSFSAEGYRPYGREVIDITADLVARAGDVLQAGGGIRHGFRRLMNSRRVGDARLAVTRVMEDAVLHHQPVADSYVFNGDGTRDGVSFHVWRVLDQRFTEADAVVATAAHGAEPRSYIATGEAEMRPTPIGQQFPQ
jgi:hypothetical protein